MSEHSQDPKGSPPRNKTVGAWRDLVDLDESSADLVAEPSPPKQTTEIVSQPSTTSSSEDIPSDDLNILKSLSPDRATPLQGEILKKDSPILKPSDVKFTKEEKKNLLIVMAVFLLLIITTILWSSSKTDDKNTSKQTPSLPVEQARPNHQQQDPNVHQTAPNKGLERGPMNEVADELPGEQPGKNQAPEVQMISILSQPLGAKVEINGVIYGTTPFIQRRPDKFEQFHLRLLLDGHKPHIEDLSPNELGHFVVNVTLERL